MCPACVASLVWIAGGGASTGAVAAVVVQKLRRGRNTEQRQGQLDNNNSGKEKK
jgi:hypothetical protein